MGVEEKEGELLITSVGENTPAQKAGLEKGDKILNLADQEIHSLLDLKYTLFYLEMDSEASIRIMRGEEEITKELTLFHFSMRR